MTVRLSGRQHFPWGYQIRADFTDADGKQYHDVLIFKTAPVLRDSVTGHVTEWTLPTQETVDSAVLASETRITRMIADAAAEFAPKALGYRITNEDGTVMDI